MFMRTLSKLNVPEKVRKSKGRFPTRYRNTAAKVQLDSAFPYSAWSSAPPIGQNPYGEAFADPRKPCDLLCGSTPDAANRSEAREEEFLAFGADSGDLAKITS